MPIKSYLAHPHEGKIQSLIDEFSKIKECTISIADNHEIIAVVTDTETKEQEEILKQKLDNLTTLKLLVMVSAFNQPQNQPQSMQEKRK